MRKPLPIDWEDMKVLALAIGLREAIRQKGLEKHESAIMQRSAREDWFGERNAKAELLRPATRAEIIAEVSGTDVSIVSKVPTAAEILSGLGTSTKAHLAGAADKAARKFNEMDGSDLVQPDVAQAAKAWTGTAAQVHGWQQAGQGQGGTVVNIAFLGPEQA